jgi:phosphonopyruvate decarboxylase
MGTSTLFAENLFQRGFNFFTGVPCSTIGTLSSYLQERARPCYVAAVREDLAIGLAVGAFLAGRKPFVFLQNSALGVCFNSIASLVLPYRIPLLLLVTWRGHLGNDSPEHAFTGAATLSLLECLSIRYNVLEPHSLDSSLTAACEHIEATGGPFAMLLSKDVLA